MTIKNFKILTLGYSYEVIENTWDRINDIRDYKIIHVLNPSLFPTKHKPESTKYIFLFKKPLKNLPKPDLKLLSNLEQNEGPTINNIIMADDRLKRLPYKEALSYLSFAAKRMCKILNLIKPNVLLSGYDGFYSTLFMLICRKENVPWFALTYTPIPKGFVGFSKSNNSFSTFAFGKLSASYYKILAENTLKEYETNNLKTFVPISENSFKNVIRFVPLRFKNAFKCLRKEITGNLDKYSQRSFIEGLFDYFRRKSNLLTNYQIEQLKLPPEKPYVFFGFHMQPEMGIDVWAPFFANQIQIIEHIARSVPPTHEVLVKLHRIDADNWSSKQLKFINKILGVRLVSHEADTKKFLQNADLVFSIQGTIALEAAMMGCEVISFAKTIYEDMLSVDRIKDIEELPLLVRKKLQKKKINRNQILLGLTTLLKRFRPGFHNNWKLRPDEKHIEQFCLHLDDMKKELKNDVTKFF